jgi:hypothetical protein
LWTDDWSYYLQFLKTTGIAAGALCIYAAVAGIAGRIAFFFQRVMDRQTREKPFGPGSGSDAQSGS